MLATPPLRAADCWLPPLPGPPSRTKVTVPVGVAAPPAEAATVAWKVRGWLKTEGVVPVVRAMVTVVPLRITSDNEVELLPT